MPRKPDDRRLSLFWDVLLIFTRGRRYAYRLVELPGEGPRTWELHRHDPPRGEPNLYLVWLPASGPRCSCPAGKRGKGCKHASAIVRLLDEGRL